MGKHPQLTKTIKGRNARLMRPKEPMAAVKTMTDIKLTKNNGEETRVPTHPRHTKAPSRLQLRSLMVHLSSKLVFL